MDEVPVSTSRKRRLLAIAVGLVALSGIGLVLAQATGAAPSVRATPLPTVAVVAALVDGDTFDVREGDAITRVRLAYVRTPPPPRPEKPPTCLAAEASARLASIIPAGTRLRLAYDRDRVGYPAAEALTDDGKFVNAEIVRAGYANIIETGLEKPIPPALADAANAAAVDATTNQRGMHSAAIGCTVPGRVKAVSDAVAQIPAAPGATAPALDLANSANRATVARMAADELMSAFAQNRQDITWLALAPAELTQLRDQVRGASDHAATLETVLRNAANLTVNHDVTQAAAHRDAARIAKVLADIRKAEADRAAQAARRAAAARKARVNALAESRARAEEAAKARREKERREKSRSADSDSRSSDTRSPDTRSPDTRSSDSDSDRSSGSRGD